MASVYDFNAMQDWNLKQNPVVPTQGVLGSMVQPDTGAIPEAKEAAEAKVPQMPTTQPAKHETSITPFGGKSTDEYKSSFNAAEERKNAWDLIKEDPQTSLIAFAMSMLANNDGTRNVTQLVGQAGLDALAAVQTREKTRYERAKAADELGYSRFKDQRSHEFDVRKQDWTEKFQKDQSARGWMDLGIKGSKEEREAQLLRRKIAMQNYLTNGGSPSGYTVGNPNVTSGTQGGEGASGSLRYNNPLGLKGGNGGPEGYRVFDSIEAAYPANLEQLKRYAKAGAVTPRDLITGKVDPSTGKHSDYAWSTASAGNPTEEYMKVLAAHGVDVDAPIDLNDPKQAATLLSAMGWMERGESYGKEWTPERVLGALNGGATATVPTVKGTGIQPTDTTGAPKIGQQSAIPGAPYQSPQYTDPYLAELEKKIRAPEPAHITRSRAMLNDPDVGLEASRAVTAYDRERQNLIKEHENALKRYQNDPYHKQQLEAMKDTRAARNAVADEIGKLQESLVPLQTMDTLLKDPNTKFGPWAEGGETLARYMELAGFDPNAVGLNTGKTYDIMGNMVMRRVFDELAMQKGVQTEGDALRAQKLWVKLGGTREGNQWINQYALNVTNRAIESKYKYAEFLERHNGDKLKAQRDLNEWVKEQPSLLPKGTEAFEMQYGLRSDPSMSQSSHEGQQHAVKNEELKPSIATPPGFRRIQ